MAIGDWQRGEGSLRLETFSDDRKALASDNLAKAEGLNSGFVGRNEEIRTLAAALEESFSGQALFCSLTGPPGIGKTRLASELAARALQRGAQVVWGRCSDFEVPSYWPADGADYADDDFEILAIASTDTTFLPLWSGRLNSISIPASRKLVAHASEGTT
jgi:hypothetical protein